MDPQVQNPKAIARRKPPQVQIMDPQVQNQNNSGDIQARNRSVCVRPRTLCRGPALPGAVCVGARRSPVLRDRAPALSGRSLSSPALSVSGPAPSLCRPRRSLCRGPALSVSGPALSCSLCGRRSLCRGLSGHGAPRRSLCRGPALSRSLCRDLCPHRRSPALCVGRGALCVGARRCLCQAPELSVSGHAAPRRSLCRGPALSRSLCRDLCPHRRSPATLCVEARRFSVSGPGALCVGALRSPGAPCVGPLCLQVLKLMLAGSRVVLCDNQ